VSTDEAANVANDLGVIGALIVVILILCGLLWLAYRSLNDKLGQVNKAVNNSPAGDPTMLERVKRIELAVDKIDTWFDDFNRNGWPSLPADIGNAAALTDTIRILQRRMEELDERDQATQTKLDAVLTELRDHVQWEMGAKYEADGGE